jgi:uncharacterized protein
MRIFTHPGLYSSGPQHWQTRWEAKYGYTRIQQRDWDRPVCEEWLATIDAAIAPHPPDQVILIGHSLACSTIVRWAEKYKRIIKGALLVGPSDVDAPSYPPGTTGFMPMPLFKLNFPSIIIASSNDEYVSMDRARYFADCWGSDLADVGDLGHINSSSDLGDWPQGYLYLQQLINS